MNDTDNKHAHAIGNAKAWSESITELIEALDKFALAEDRGEELSLEVDGSTMTSREDVERHISESPLSVQVRGGWHTPAEEAEDVEYEILLSTGGPALRIVGDLNQYNEPGDARLEWQDWFTPWTRYDDLYSDQREALLRFAQQFYFGEG